MRLNITNFFLKRKIQHALLLNEALISKHIYNISQSIEGKYNFIIRQKLSDDLTNEVLKSGKHLSEKHTNNDFFINLKNKIINDTFIHKYKLSYCYLKSYQDKLNLITSSDCDIDDPVTNLANEFPELSPTFSFKNLKSLIKMIKHERILISNRTSKEDLSNELQSAFPSIKLSDISWVVSVYTLAILIGGYLDNYIFFKSLNININDYYDINDYISTSLDKMTIILFLIILAGVHILSGISNALYEEISEYPTIGKKSNIKSIISLTILLLFLFCALYVDFTKNQTIDTIALFFILYFIFLFFPNIFNFLDLFEKRFINQITLCSLIIFYACLFSTTYNDLSKLKNGNYKPQYSYILQEAYLDFGKLEYLSLSSRFIFLLNKENHEVIILPSAAIKNITVRYEHD
jgi:hypothetical protein